jgi:hypothetical protein
MKISFDYDGTLADDFDGSTNYEKDKVIAKLKELQSENHEIFIVTKRFSPNNAHKGLVNEHIDVLRLAAELKIPGTKVIFTDRKFKADKLIELSIDQHFENSNEELYYFLNNHTNSSMNYIMVSSSPWKIYNAMSVETI